MPSDADNHRRHVFRESPRALTQSEALASRRPQGEEQEPVVQPQRRKNKKNVNVVVLPTSMAGQQERHHRFDRFLDSIGGQDASNN
jgi:esterase/lipase superfamily enzyme